MKIAFKIIIILILAFSFEVQAQNAASLIKEGIQLHQEKDFSAAIEKYKVALQLDPDNPAANYQMGFSLNASGKPEEALSYLEKAVVHTTSTPALVATYNLMGSIYDHASQPEKAIDSYQKGIKEDASNHSLWYNLGLAYSRNQQYAEAAQSAVEALKIEPKDPETTRLYALVNFHQNKRVAALMALCNLLWLEPAGKSSGEAYANMQSILKGGELKKAAGAKKVPPLDEQNLMLNRLLVNAVAQASKKQYSSPALLLGAQLQAVFSKLGESSLDLGESDTFFNQLSQFYYQLSLTPQVPFFANLISQQSEKNAALWVKNHPLEIADLNEWLLAQYQ